MKYKWYCQTWFIALLFALWFLVLPPIVGVVLIIVQAKTEPQIKIDVEKELSRLNLLKNDLTKEIDSLTSNRDSEKQKIIAEIQSRLDDVNNQIKIRTKELNKLNNTAKDLEKEIISLEDEITLQEFGIYDPVYDFANSEQYKDRLTLIRQQQKQMIKDKVAVSFPTHFTLDGSLSKGKALVNDNVKQILRSFNNECDVLINKVKFNTVDNARKKIEKSFEQLNKMNQRMQISIIPSYLNLKLDELNLAYEYTLKKQEEQEAAKEERARLREEAKLRKEIEEARAAAKKEQQHYENALKAILVQLQTDPENTELLKKKAEIEEHAETIIKNLQDIDYREANKRAGYVYIISNIGSFGEDVYKIGMTRRIKPLERVNELGDASVPFNFDVHAMIFSDDAPALETALHKAFKDKKVNMVNTRREFFRVSLDEIKAVVNANFDKTVEFKNTPDAEQYRESLMIEKAIRK